MLFRRRQTLAPPAREALTRILTAPTFELVPLKNALDQAAFLPPRATVSVTASPAKGIDATLDWAARLQADGFRAIPHLSARMIASRSILAGLLLVTADHERPVDARALEPGDEVGQVGSVADHPGREMRHRPEAPRLELLAQRDRRLDALRRRRRHRDRRPRRQECRLVEGVLQRHELERRRGEDPGQRLTRGRRERLAAAEEHRPT